MAIKTGEAHREDLKSLRPKVYIKGEKVEGVWGDPRLQSTLNLVSQHHDIVFKEEMKDLAVVVD